MREQTQGGRVRGEEANGARKENGSRAMEGERAEEGWRNGRRSHAGFTPEELSYVPGTCSTWSQHF